MIELHKPVIRKFCRGSLFDRHQLVITLDPEGYLKMRLKGCQTEYMISFEALYYLIWSKKKPKKGG
jgi:hypothetical protein